MVLFVFEPKKIRRGEPSAFAPSQSFASARLRLTSRWTSWCSPFFDDVHDRDELCVRPFQLNSQWHLKRNKQSAAGVQDLKRLDGKRHERWKRRTSCEIIMRTMILDYKGIKSL
jgi:hypothetical protein